MRQAAFLYAPSLERDLSGAYKLFIFVSFICPDASQQR